MPKLFAKNNAAPRLAVLMLALQLASCGSPDKRAQEYYEDGARLLAQHDNKKAVVEFKNAIRLKKDFALAWRGLAEAQEKAQDWPALATTLDAISQLDPNDVETRLKLARLFLLGGVSDRALKLVDDLEAKGITKNPDALALKAAIFYKLKDKDAALRAARAALTVDPGHIDALMIVALNDLDDGDAHAALQIVESDPFAQARDPGILLFKIRVFEQSHDLPQIEKSLRELIKLYPAETAFRKQLTKFYVDQHRLDDAEKELRATVVADPKDPQALLDLVHFLYINQGAAVARQELLDRIKAGGNVFAYQMALAEFDFALGNYADSFNLLKSLANGTGSPAQALNAKLKLANMNFDRKNYDVADEILSNILRGGNRNANVLKLKGAVHLARGELESGISDLREALNDQPESTDVLLLLATAYERKGAIDLSEKQFSEAFKASGFDAKIGLEYVAFLRRRSSPQRAEDVLVDLAARQPQNVRILSALAEVKLARQDWVGAQEIGETIRRLSAGTGIADQIIGAAFSGQQKYDQSIAAFQSAVAASPSAIQPMVFLVREFVRAKQFDRAVAFLRAVLKSDPENAQAYVLLGSIQLASNEPDEAMKNFMAAIEKRPKDFVGYNALADLYIRQNNREGALTVIRSGLKEQPDSGVLHMAAAGILEQMGDYDGAVAEYSYVLTQQPGSMIAANNLASILADHFTDKASLQRAQTLAAMLDQSHVPEFRDTLGWVSYRQGDLKAAVPLLQEAVAALPEVGLVHYHLGMAYAGSGQEAMASQELRTALTKRCSAEVVQAIKNALAKIETQ
jgi:cellulose synthase operon protein C